MLTEKQKEIARQTAAEKDKVFADMRRSRMEDQMTGRIRAAWAQLDVATDECVRLATAVQVARADGDQNLAVSFDRDLKLEQAKAMGKAEILALIMPAPLDTPKAISEEAGRRYQAKRAGRKYETPGIRMVGASVMDDLEPNQQWT